MITLRRAAEQALAAIKSANQVNYSWACVEAVAALETALAEDAMQRLTDVSQEIEAALAEPEQEPVAWMAHQDKMLPTFHRTFTAARDWADNPTPLYTTPPQRKPLTDEEIEQAYRHIYHNVPDGSYRTTYYWIEQGIRYAEQAHGIKTAQ